MEFDCQFFQARHTNWTRKNVKIRIIQRGGINFSLSSPGRRVVMELDGAAAGPAVLRDPVRAAGAAAGRPNWMAILHELA